MKTISDALKAHLAGQVLTVAQCWKITRADGRIFGFTTHSTSITYLGVTYYPNTGGFTRTAQSIDMKLGTPNLEVEGYIYSGAITREDVMAGKWSGARALLFLVNWADLTMGHVVLLSGFLGEITVKDSAFVAEFVGLTDRLTQTVGDCYQAFCRARFCDDKCGLNRNYYRVLDYVGAVSPDMPYNGFACPAAASQTDDFYMEGEIEWVTGDNATYTADIDVHSSGWIYLLDVMPKPIKVGDTFYIYQGCAKTADACKAFGNFVNFRGEPLLPGVSRLYDYPVTYASN